jgi:hypothetical protein
LSVRDAPLRKIPERMHSRFFNGCACVLVPTFSTMEIPTVLLTCPRQLLLPACERVFPYFAASSLLACSIIFSRFLVFLGPSPAPARPHCRPVRVRASSPPLLLSAWFFAGINRPRDSVTLGTFCSHMLTIDNGSFALRR